MEIEEERTMRERKRGWDRDREKEKRKEWKEEGDSVVCMCVRDR